jgi:putative heme-binding domain-containing protein
MRNLAVLGCLAFLLWLPYSSRLPAADETTAAAAKDHAVVEALLRLPSGTLAKHPEQLPAVLRYLSRNIGTTHYINVVRQLNVPAPTDQLVDLLATATDQNIRVAAAKLLIEAEAFEAIQQALHRENADEAAAAARALWSAWHRQTFVLLQGIVADTSSNLQVRIAAAEALGRSEPGQKFLLQRAQRGEIDDSLLLTLTNSLLESKTAEIRAAAEQVLPKTITAKSEKLPPISELAGMRGERSQGQVVFSTIGTCNKCHKVNGEGKEVGPDLSEIGSKLSREDMLVAILNPSAAISHNYETYGLLDVDGRVLSGLLINQTDREVTIRNAEGIDETVATEDIEQLKKQPLSLMPADLQKAMSLQNLVDLVDYLASLRKAGEGPFEVVSGVAGIEDPRDPRQAVAGFDIADGLAV